MRENWLVKSILHEKSGEINRIKPLEANAINLRACRPLVGAHGMRPSLAISVVDALCGGNFWALPENYPHIYYPPQGFQKNH